MLTTGLNEGLSEKYCRQLINTLDKHQYPILKRYAVNLLKQLDMYYPGGTLIHSNRVIHDDLHLGNIIFSDIDPYRVVGIIDFAEVTLGDVEREMRQIHNLDPVISLAAINEFERLNGIKISLERLQFWSRLATVTILIDRIHRSTVYHISYKRACSQISKQNPGENWDELYRMD